MSNYTLYITDECVVSVDNSFLLAESLDDYRHRTSADGLTSNNQTNLAIKGIIAIEAMSKMSSVVRKTADADKYSVCADVLDVLRKFDSFIGYSLEPLHSMERPCAGQ